MPKILPTDKQVLASNLFYLLFFYRLHAIYFRLKRIVVLSNLIIIAGRRLVHFQQMHDLLFNTKKVEIMFLAISTITVYRLFAGRAGQ